MLILMSLSPPAWRDLKRCYFNQMYEITKKGVCQTIKCIGDSKIVEIL